jgi:hypothetical protein
MTYEDEYETTVYVVRFQVLTAATMKMTFLEQLAFLKTVKGRDILVKSFLPI